MRLAVPDLEAARDLAQRWSGGAGGLVTDWQALPPEAAEAALRAGHVDLAFVPTLSVLRDPDAFAVVPGVALVGKAYRPAHLHLPLGLEPLRPRQPLRVGVNPRFPQEALLAQVVLRELYGVTPQFVPYEGEVPEGLSAVLLSPGDAVPGTGLTLDLGREWFELTTRPMVWALLAVTAGGIEGEEARFLRDIAREGEEGEDEGGLHTEEPASTTLAAYAHAGLDAWVDYLFYHRALPAVPEIPFAVIPEDGVADDEEGEDTEN